MHMLYVALSIQHQIFLGVTLVVNLVCLSNISLLIFMSRSLQLLSYIVVSTVKVEDLRFQMRTKNIWKLARLSYLLVRLAAEMIFINRLGCLVLPLKKLVSICKPSYLLTHGLFLLCAYFLLPFQVCYVAFWDEITLATQEAQGQKFGADHYIGKWRIIIVKNLPFADQRLNGKIPKVLNLFASFIKIWDDVLANSLWKCIFLQPDHLMPYLQITFHLFLFGFWHLQWFDS